MRGTLPRLLLIVRDMRFIPAYAGNTNMISISFATPSVHPRVCGEHQRQNLDLDSPDGSSPRMRGTHEHRASGHRRGWFIPAYAGNTAGDPCPPLPFAVHPRVCGEHELADVLIRILNGSSPRMRGTRWLSSWHGQMHRFIPAYAGNTKKSCVVRATTSVHPRVCGEHDRRRRSPVAGHGSSPRMRGTRSPS